jgi:hypothetical protein
MNIFAICNNRTQNPLAPLTFFAPALAVFLFAGCRHRAEQPPLVDQQEMRSHVVGAWAESHGTNENLQFNDDGTLQMDSPREHHTCAYDFPDAAHIRLNCSPAGAPPSFVTWNFSVHDDTLAIGDTHETGTYKRK